MIKLVFAVCIAIFLPLSIVQTGHAAQVPYSALPVPVKAYILKSSVEFGVDSPESIRSNDDYDDHVPGLTNSDLNADGTRDYSVALCMFNESAREFWANGYPCNTGVLIISNGYGGYQYMATGGLIISAQAGQVAKIVVRERQVDGGCDDYVCDVEYQIGRASQEMQYEFKRLRVCMPDGC